MADPPRRGRQPHRFLGLVASTFLLGFCVLSAVLVVQAIQNANRSSLTQHHGITVVARVVRVDNISTPTKGDTEHTSRITVTLPQAIDGQNTSTAHLKQSSDAQVGSPITVLVDPREIGYAELPGQPKAQVHQWVVLLVVLLAFLCMTVAVIRWTFRRNDPASAADVVYRYRHEQKPNGQKWLRRS